MAENAFVSEYGWYWQLHQGHLCGAWELISSYFEHVAHSVA